MAVAVADAMAETASTADKAMAEAASTVEEATPMVTCKAEEAVVEVRVHGGRGLPRRSKPIVMIYQRALTVLTSLFPWLRSRHPRRGSRRRDFRARTRSTSWRGTTSRRRSPGGGRPGAATTTCWWT